MTKRKEGSGATSSSSSDSNDGSSSKAAGVTFADKVSGNAAPKRSTLPSISLDPFEATKRSVDTLKNVQEDITRRIREKKLARDIRENIFDLLKYVVFLVVFTLVQYNSRSEVYAFRYNDAMKDLFINEEFPDIDIYKSFHDVNTETEMWQWVRGVMIPGLFSEHQVVYGNNLILGTTRLRQIKVRPNEGCFKFESFIDVVEDCYPPYDKDYVDTEPFGPPENTSLWTYRTADELDTFVTTARLVNYEGGGYVFDFLWSDPISNHVARADFLESNGWITRATRAVVVDFTTYNANTDAFNVVQLVFEYLPAGGVVPSQTFRVMRLHKYHNDAAGILMEIGEIIIVAFTLIYLLEELYEIFYFSGSCVHHFQDGWNTLDMFIVMLFISAFSVRIALWAKFFALKLDPTNPYEFFSFQKISLLNSTEQNIYATCALVLWFKIFKFTRFLPFFNVISATMARAVTNTSAFIVIVTFVLFGFAQSGWQAFGTDVFGFHSFIDTFYTLLRVILGDFNFLALQYSNRVFGPFYFLLYIVLVFFVLLSMFLAILNDSFVEVQSELSAATSKSVNVVTMARKALAERFKWLEERTKETDVLMEKIGVDLDEDEFIEISTVKEIFSKYEEEFRKHLHISSAEELLGKFDLDADNVLDKKEQAALLARLEAKKFQYHKQHEALEWEAASLEDAHAPVKSLAIDTLLLNMRSSIDKIEKKVNRITEDLKTIKQ